MRLDTDADFLYKNNVGFIDIDYKILVFVREKILNNIISRNIGSAP